MATSELIAATSFISMVLFLSAWLATRRRLADARESELAFALSLRALEDQRKALDVLSRRAAFGSPPQTPGSAKEAIEAEAWDIDPQGYSGEGAFYDARLWNDFETKGKGRVSALQYIRQAVETSLAQLSPHNTLRVEFYRRYAEIIADCNQERVSVEATFARLMELASGLTPDQSHKSGDCLDEVEVALDGLLARDDLSPADRERVRVASEKFLESVRTLIAPGDRRWQTQQPLAEVETFILDRVFQELPSPIFSDDDKMAIAKMAYDRSRRNVIGSLTPTRE